MNYVLVIALCMQLFLTYEINGKNILSISFITNGVFLFSATVFAVLKNYFSYTVSLKTVLIIITSIICLLLGEKIGNTGNIKLGENCKNLTCKNDNKLILVKSVGAILIGIIGIVIAFLSYYHLYLYSVKLGNPGEFFEAAAYTRTALVSGESGYALPKLLSYSGIVIQAFSYIYLYIFAYNFIMHKKVQVLLLLPLLANALIQLSSTERIVFIQMLCVVIIIFAVLYKAKNLWRRKNDKKIIRIAIIAVLLFFVIFFLIGKLQERYKSNDIMDTIGMYVGSSIIGLDMYLREPWKSGNLFGQQTLFNIYNNLNAIGFQFQIDSFMPFFSWENDASNIYTCLVKPMEDYGVLGMLVTRVALGFFYGVFTEKIRKISSYRREAFTVIMYGFFMYPVAISSIADSYMFYLQLPFIYLFIVLFFLLHCGFFKSKFILKF